MKPYLIKLHLASGLIIKSLAFGWTIEEATQKAMLDAGECHFIYAMEV